MKKSIYAVATTAAAVFGFAALAMNAQADQEKGGKDMGMDMGGMNMDSMKSHSAGRASMTEGVVRGVDKANKSILLKHGPIENMHMGAMTMAFVVKDVAMLSKVKDGDKVKFSVENIDGVATITALNVEQ
ncbi:copper transporter [Noviherbaspirillum cavernae]|uniref:Copper transporter n=1 Tax=Noviherbaspirillum cavernae TaxID=2320862 RepID=A0A418WYZ2_9BURK|nr:copper-binding protein [Noviherbaspirillum cavernae]RJG05412.1 copper transporter [Noviherbaspirillum cavernae]